MTADLETIARKREACDAALADVDRSIAGVEAELGRLRRLRLLLRDDRQQLMPDGVSWLPTGSTAKSDGRD